jgi:hypothetical protein
MTEKKGRAVKKKVASRAKVETKKTSASKSKSKTTKKVPLSAEQREQKVRDAAYFRALERGFVGGCPVQDWLDAEAEVAQSEAQAV